MVCRDDGLKYESSIHRGVALDYEFDFKAHISKHNHTTRLDCGPDLRLKPVLELCEPSVTFDANSGKLAEFPQPNSYHYSKIWDE